MFPFEVLVVIYCACLALAAVALTRARHRGRALATALVTGTVAALAGRGDVPDLARLTVLPLLYIGAGYWIPAMLVPVHRTRGERTRFEEWLVASDERLRPLLPALPRPLSLFAEVAYLGCYPLVPICLGLVWVRGQQVDVAHYWTTVLAAGYACYASLPWLVSRPPALLMSAANGADARPAAGQPPPVARLNRWVLSRVSHSWTTFPSGHVAVSFAAASALARVWPAAGIVAALFAAGVGLGAAAGRYHFIIDVVAGLAVALAIVVIT